MRLAVLAQLAALSSSDPFQGHPKWLVLLVGTLLAAVLLWIFGKLMKWTIWVLIVVVVIGGLIAAGRPFLNA